MHLLPSQILWMLATLLFTGTVLILGYVALPWTVRRVERKLTPWVSPLTLIAYMLTVTAAFLASIGN